MEPNWDGAAADDSSSANDVVEKEAVIKDILGMQDSLRALLDRISTVKTERDKLKKDNETLQTYIDNLTRNNREPEMTCWHGYQMCTSPTGPPQILSRPYTCGKQKPQ